MTKRGDRELVIAPGTAIDREGREIVLSAPFIVQVPAFDANSHTYVTIEYRELFEQSDLETVGGVEGHLRITELPEIKLRKHHHSGDEGAVELARVHLDEFSNVRHVDQSVRKRAGGASEAGQLYVVVAEKLRGYVAAGARHLVVRIATTSLESQREQLEQIIKLKGSL